MSRRILSILGILVLMLSITQSSVFAMPDLPFKPTKPVTPFHPIYPPNYFRPSTQSTGKGGGINAQAIAMGQPGTAFSNAGTFGTADVGYFDSPSSSDTNVYLNSPNGISMDSSGNVYVVEEYGARLLKFDSSKNLVWKVGIAGFRDWGTTGLNQPVGVALGPDGNVWVTDQDHFSVFASSNGDVIQQFPAEPWNADDNTKFYQLRGVAFDKAGRLYLADGNRDRIQVFTFDGSGNPVYAATIGQTDNPGDADDQLSYPDGIAIDSSNDVFVADRGNNRLQKCAPTGSSWPWDWNCSTVYGTNGQGNGDNQLNGPGGLWIDTSDNVYLADTMNNRILKCPSTGGCNTLISNIASLGYPTTGAVNPSNGHLFITLFDQSVIVEYDASGNLVQTFAGVNDVPYLTDAQHFNGPYAIDVDSKGEIILAENWGNRLIKLSSSGAVLWAKGTAGKHPWVSDPNTEFAGPQALAVDKNGIIYVAGDDYVGPNVRFYKPDGSLLKIFDQGWGQGPYQFEDPDGIAVDSSGNLFIADGSAQVVKEYNKSSVFVRQIGYMDISGPDNAHFNVPRGVTTDSAGNLYVADYYNCRVQKFSKNGSFLMTFSTTQCGNQIDRLGGPADVAVDAQGRVYVTDDQNLRVQVYDKTGAYLTTIGGGWGSNTGELRNPEGIALDSKGNVYVADEYNARIQKYAPGVPYWAQQNLDGFGKLDNAGVFALTSFNGALYAGTYITNGQGAQIWRKGSAGWQEIIPDGFEDGNNIAIDDLFTFNGYLYASTANCTNSDCSTSNGGQLWRSPDGYTWQPVETDGFGDSNNSDIFYLAQIGTKLCASTWNNAGEGAQLWCSASGDPGTWTQDGVNGFGNTHNETFTSSQIYNGAVYLGTFNSTDGTEIYKKTLPSGSWTKVGGGGFGDSGNDGSTLTVFNQFLYVAFEHANGGGGMIWRCQICDGSDWINVMNDGNGSPNANSTPALMVIKTAIYAFFGGNDGMYVYQSKNGLSWVRVGSIGPGSSNNKGIYWNNGTNLVNNTLYVGTFNLADGAELLKFCPTTASCK